MSKSKMRRNVNAAQSIDDCAYFSGAMPTHKMTSQLALKFYHGSTQNGKATSRPVCSPSLLDN
eukprot:scaffold2093_cov161-Amphora_coffeaeformis.AAC.4